MTPDPDPDIVTMIEISENIRSLSETVDKFIVKATTPTFNDDAFPAYPIVIPSYVSGFTHTPIPYGPFPGNIRSYQYSFCICGTRVMLSYSADDMAVIAANPYTHWPYVFEAYREKLCPMIHDDAH